MFSLNPLLWLRYQGPTQKGRTRQRPPLRPFRPQVECLENRLAPATLHVTTHADVVNPNDGKLSLREAITMANAAAAAHPDTIVLGKGTYKSATGEFIITQSMTIEGQGAGLTTVDGAGLGRIFDVRGTIDATFANMSLCHGAGQNDGGAIQALTANLRVVNCQLSDNSGLEGGAIHDQGGNVTVIGSTVSRNVVQGDGGGILLNGGTLVLNDTTVGHNLAGGDGGGISSSFAANLVNSTVSGNHATGGFGSGFGGGIHAGTATLLHPVRKIRQVPVFLDAPARFARRYGHPGTGARGAGGVLGSRRRFESLLPPQPEADQAEKDKDRGQGELDTASLAQLGGAGFGRRTLKLRLPRAFLDAGQVARRPPRRRCADGCPAPLTGIRPEADG
jgi:hypothetical protein